MKVNFILLMMIICCISCSNNSSKNKWLNTNIEGNLLEECPSLKDDFFQAEL